MEETRKVGRPLKFQSVEDLVGVGDGLIATSEPRIIFNDFKSENSLVDYVCFNIGKFTKQYLDDDLVSLNAKNTTEIRAGIGQLLDYGREYLDPKKELILLANMYDENTAKTIEFYNLPIRYIVFSKDKSLEFYGTE